MFLAATGVGLHRDHPYSFGVHPGVSWRRTRPANVQIDCSRAMHDDRLLRCGQPMSDNQSRNSRTLALQRIRTAMIEKKITQAGLADAADCHEKTVQNLMGGRSVRDQTLFDVCMVLDLDFDELKAQWAGAGPAGEPLRDEPGQAGAGMEIAPDLHGWLHPCRRRPSDRQLSDPAPLFHERQDVVFAFRTEIAWDESWPSLLFQEHNRPDAPYSHRGRVHVPPSSQFIHLVSLTKGAMRMVLLARKSTRPRPCAASITTLSRDGADDRASQRANRLLQRHRKLVTSARLW